ncbi:MAG: hypothetical protein RL160_471, partial [Bacteroidota bacterium]
PGSLIYPTRAETGTQSAEKKQKPRIHRWPYSLPEHPEHQPWRVWFAGSKWGRLPWQYTGKKHCWPNRTWPSPKECGVDFFRSSLAAQVTAKIHQSGCHCIASMFFPLLLSIFQTDVQGFLFHARSCKHEVHHDYFTNTAQTAGA